MNCRDGENGGVAWARRRTVLSTKPMVLFAYQELNSVPCPSLRKIRPCSKEAMMETDFVT